MVGRQKELKIHFLPGQVRVSEEDVAVPSRRVLVTGATGVLGRAVCREFKDHEWHVLGCGHSRARPRFEKLDLLDAEAIRETVQDFQPHVIVHCAAKRRLDAAEKDPEGAAELNVVASGNLAKEAAQVGAFLIYISTDYVFDGTNPPYVEDDIPNPLSVYGRTKLEGETAVLQNSEGAVVLRVPALYGEVENLEENPITLLFQFVQCSHKPDNIDHLQQRFPTHVKDVATVCRQLSEKKITDPSLKGIFHWSGNEQMTKYDITCAMADAFKLPHNHLKPVTVEPVSSIRRPINPKLDCSKLENMGIGQHTPFQDGIKESLWPFLVDKRWRQTVFH